MWTSRDSLSPQKMFFPLRHQYVDQPFLETNFHCSFLVPHRKCLSNCMDVYSRLCFYSPHYLSGVSRVDSPLCFYSSHYLSGVSRVDSPLSPVHFTCMFIIPFYAPDNLVLTDAIRKHVTEICNTEVVALPGYTISGMANWIAFGKVEVSRMAALLALPRTWLVAHYFPNILLLFVGLAGSANS